MFELGLGEIALAFTAASTKADQAAIAEILTESAHDDFAAAWLRHKGLDWAADLLASEPVKPQGTTTPALEITQ